MRLSFLVILSPVPLAANPETCFSTNPNENPEISVPACTDAIRSGSLDGVYLGEAYSNRGVAQRELGHFSQSAKDLEKAVELNPDPNNQRMLAWTYREMSRNAEAETIYTEVLETDDNWQGWLSRCVVRQDLDKYKDALDDCHEALFRAPDNEDALFFTARAYNALGKAALALPLAERAVRISPERSYYWQEWARAAYLSGDVEKAISIAEDALEHFPGDPDIGQFLISIRR